MTASEHMTLIEDCERNCLDMSEWECDFVDSIKNQMEKGMRLTEKQVAILERIWSNVT